MADFTGEQQGQFGVPGALIEATLSDIYDPYSGMDLRTISSCDHVEVMTLPSGLSSDLTYCDDPFASNGPKWFGGTGAIGNCRNFGRVNVRSMGVLPGGSGHTEYLGYWAWAAGNGENNTSGQTGDPGPHDRFSAFNHWYYGPLGPAFWGFLGPDGNKIEGDPTWDQYVHQYPSYTSQYNKSSLNFSHDSDSDISYAGTPPGFGEQDYDHNVTEIRLYWSPNDEDFLPGEDEGIFRFAYFSDDWGSFFMDDGCGNNIELGNGGEFTGHPGGPGCDSCHGDNRYGGGLVNYCYGWFDKTITKTCASDGRPTTYRILVRHFDHHGQSNFDSGYMSPVGKAANGGSWRAYTDISTRNGLKQNCNYIFPTYINPPGEDNESTDVYSGDGAYYRTDALQRGEVETPYYEAIPGGGGSNSQAETINYVRSIRCGTILQRPIANFSRMRAVCKDGSYVEMANNGGSINEDGTSNYLLDPELGDDIPEYTTNSYEVIFQTDSNDWSPNENTTISGGISSSELFSDGLIEVRVKKIRLRGDFDSGSEYLRDFTIGGYNFGNLSTGLQNASSSGWRNVYIDDTGELVSLNGEFITQNGLSYSFFVMPNVDYTSPKWDVQITLDVIIQEELFNYASNYGDYLFLSGDDACKSITQFNSELYYLSDSDKRPTLGLFATLDNNITSEYFEEIAGEDLFTQVTKKQFIQNGDGRYMLQDQFHIGTLGPKSFKPAGDWNYISFDGTGFNLTQGNTPGNHPEDPENIDSNGDPILNLPHEYPDGGYSKRFIQHPSFTTHGSEVNGYAGFYPYLLALSEPYDAYSEFSDSLNYDFQWAAWVKDSNCYSYGRCLKFQADDKWEDINNLIDNAKTAYGEQSDTFFTEILQIANENQYRTINQYQKFYEQGKDNTLNPYSSLKVSFWMKTLNDDLYDPDNPPHVQASVTRGGSPNKSKTDTELNAYQYQIKTEYNNSNYVLNNRLVDVEPIPVFQILVGERAPDSDFIQPSGDYYDGWDDPGAGFRPDLFYSHGMPFFQTDTITETESLRQTVQSFSYNTQTNTSFVDYNFDVFTVNNLNVCSFKFGEGEVENTYLQQWALLNTPYGPLDPHRLDISKSGYPYWSVSEVDPPDWWLEGTAQSGDPSWPPSDGVNLPNHMDWLGGWDASNDGNNFLAKSRPAALGNIPFEMISQHPLGYQYEASPLGCASFIGKHVMAEYFADASVRINMPDYFMEQSEDFMSTIAWDDVNSEIRPEYLIVGDEEDTDIVIRGYNTLPDVVSPPINWPDIVFKKYTIYSYRNQDVEFLNLDAGSVFYNKDYLDQTAGYNSITSNSEYKYNAFGSANIFKNEATNVWEKMEYTFNFYSGHTYQETNIRNLYLLLQATSITSDGGFRGTVLIDNIEITEAYDFKPDVDVRKKKGPNNYGSGDLTKYYDPTIPGQLQPYKDTTAPLEVQFYFYPRYNYNDFLSKTPPIIYNDFRLGMFYLYDVDWGDGSPKEFTSEPEELGENKAVYHTYENSGIYEVTGTMIRMKPGKDYEPIGVIHNERFVVRININKGLDEDFTYFGSDGFSFIPYKNTLPIIGGYSEQSIYYKSTKRQLGVVTNETNVNTKFDSVGDRLKTEIAMDNMDSSHTKHFELLNAFKKKRYQEPTEKYFLQPTTGIYIDEWSHIPEENYVVWPGPYLPIDNSGTIPFEITAIRKFSYENPQYDPENNLIYHGVVREANGNWNYYAGLYALEEGETYAFSLGGNFPFNWDLLDVVNGNESEIVSRGLKSHSDELGYSIGDSDLTNIRYFNKPKQMWEMLGFNEVPEYLDATDLSDEYLATLDFPTNFEEYNINEEGSYTLDQGDGIAWVNVGRPDIAAAIQSIVDGDTPQPESIYDDSEPGEQGGSTPQPRPFSDFYNETIIPNNDHPGNPSSPKYWKKIIPEDYSIFERDGINPSTGLLNLNIEQANHEQGWRLSGLYRYPVLPKYGADGKFIEDEYPYGYEPFPLNGPITDEYYIEDSLKISIANTNIESNILDDNSGNGNYGFIFNDYKPKFDNETLKPKKTRKTPLTKTSTKDGAF